MYKQLIYGVSAMLIGGAAFYFNQAGVPDLIVNGGNDNRGNGVSAAQVFSGTYICKENTGCKNSTRLILEEDTTLDVVSTVDNREISLGQGTWGVGAGGAIVMILRNPGISIDNYPSSLIATKVSGIKITGFSKKKPLFEGMEDPVFIREEENKPTTQTRVEEEPVVGVE